MSAGDDFILAIAVEMDRFQVDTAFRGREMRKPARSVVIRGVSDEFFLDSTRRPRYFFPRVEPVLEGYSMNVKMWLWIAFVAAMMMLGGCEQAVEITTAPKINFLESQVKIVDADQTLSLVIGESLTFYGKNFLRPAEGQTKLRFEGTYVWSNDQGEIIAEKVTPFVIAPMYDGEYVEPGVVGDFDVPVGTQTLRINRFGPFDVPFTHGGNRVGTFNGTVQALNYHADGTIEENEDPFNVIIEVKPSIIIRMLEPVIGFEDGKIQTPGCGGPALRAIGGIPYVIEVEAVGFQPKYFLYDFTNINGETDWSPQITHPADGDVDRIGDPAWHSGEIVVFNPVSEDDERSISSIRVTAIDEDNNAYFTALPLSIVRPVHFHYDGRRQLAERYDPVAVFGPLKGSIGTVVTYAETHSESRQNSVSVSVSSSFTQSQGSLSSSNWSEGVSETNSISNSNSAGQTHSETANSSETYGNSYSSSEQTSTNVSSTDGTQWGWIATEGLTAEEYATQAKEVYGEVSGAVTTTVSGEGSVPGFAKVGGSVGTTLGSKVGGSTGSTTGQKVGSSNQYGEHMYNNESETTAFGSSTTDSTSASFSGTYGLATQNGINTQTTETEAASNSVTYNVGGSEGITENFTEGSQETWSETWVNTETDVVLFSYSSQVPYGACAVVYRQTIRYVRAAQLYNYDLCGVRTLIGDALFNEWSWAPNITVAGECETELPKSDLPEAACFVACGN